MAKPIELTPTLRGEDAERLLRIMEDVKPISESERNRMRSNYEYFRSIATFEIPECKI